MRQDLLISALMHNNKSQYMYIFDHECLLTLIRMGYH